MLNKVRHFIAENRLLDKKRRYLVALSGGADSVSLLLILIALGYDVDAVHCNFKLRGSESERDEQFCIDLCKRHSVPLHLARFDTQSYAIKKKISIEMAARELRYGYFEQLRKDLSADGICVGHHQEDSVETVLLNLIRGTGLRGLVGIRPRNGYILRPLLSVSKHDIEQFLEDRGETYITDSSNLEDNVQRNKLRLNIIPQLKALNPSFNDSVAQMSVYLSEVEKVAEGAMNAALAKYSLSLDGLQKAEEVKVKRQEILDFYSSEYFLFRLLAPLGFNSAQLKEIGEGLHTGQGQLWQSNGYEATFTQSDLIIRSRKSINMPDRKFPETGIYVIDGEKRVHLSFIDDVWTVTTDKIKENPLSAYLDADAVKFPLTLRRVAVGDKFRPLGMKGMRLVSDFLTDLKKNRFEKRDQLLVEDAEGKVLWLVGLRTDDRVKVASTTKKILRIAVENSNRHEQI